VTRTPIIPAPAWITPAAGEYRLAPGATIGYHGPVLAPLARRFGQDVARRCGLPLRPVPAQTGEGGGGHAIVIGLGDDQDLKELPAPLGLHPAGTARDERYVLTIDRAGIRLRAPEPAGVAGRSGDLARASRRPDPAHPALGAGRAHLLQRGVARSRSAGRPRTRSS
jgi:hypothetical protein